MSNPEEEQNPPEGLTLLELSELNPSSFFMSTLSNQINIVLQKLRLTTTADGAVTKFAKLENIAILSLSPQSAKDLYLLLHENIPKYEKEFGEIHTTFSKKPKQK